MSYLTTLVLSALLDKNQPDNDIGQKLYEITGDRKRLVLIAVESPKSFNVNGNFADQLRALSTEYAGLLGSRPELTRIHVL